MEYIDSFITKSSKEIKFRYPTINDAQILMDYINKLSTEQSFILFQGHQQTLKAETKWLKEKIKETKSNKGVYLCAFNGNQLVGCGEITLGNNAKSHVGDFGISVTFDFRGEGIGQKLMELIISESIKKLSGLKIITLEVFGENKIAQSLYKKMGFIKFGCLPKSLERKGKMDDAILMYKKV